MSEATWPAQVHDVKTCLRWVRANADKVGIDSEKIAMMGFSAGAVLALICGGSQNQPGLEGDGGNGGVPTDVAACVAFYPAAFADPGRALTVAQAEGQTNPGVAELPLTPRGQRALQNAADEACRAGQPFIGTEFLLLGLLREPGGIGAQILNQYGVSLGAAREAISAAIAQTSVPFCGPAGQSKDLSPGPIDYIKPGFPPTILLHGVADRLAMENSVALFDALRKVETPVELHLLEGVTHIFDKHAEFADVSAELVDLFLDRHVANPRSYPSTEPPPVGAVGQQERR